MALDKNGDKSLQLDEMMGRPPQRENGGSTGSGGQRAGGNRGGGGGSLVERVMERDKDGDGKVSKEEAGEQMGRFFGNMGQRQRWVRHEDRT